MVWPSFRPNSGSKSKVSGRILKSFRGPFSSAEVSAAALEALEPMLHVVVLLHDELLGSEVSDRRRNTPKSGQNRSESLCARTPCRVFWAWFGIALGPIPARNRRFPAGSLKVFGALLAQPRLGQRQDELGVVTIRDWPCGRTRNRSAERAPTTFKDPAGNLRFRAGIVPKAKPNQAQNTRHGAHRPAHNDSERFWPDFGVFRRRSETFKL